VYLYGYPGHDYNEYVIFSLKIKCTRNAQGINIIIIYHPYERSNVWRFAVETRREQRLNYSVWRTLIIRWLRKRSKPIDVLINTRTISGSDTPHTKNNAFPGHRAHRPWRILYTRVYVHVFSFCLRTRTSKSTIRPLLRCIYGSGSRYEMRICCKPYVFKRYTVFSRRFYVAIAMFSENSSAGSTIFLFFVPYTAQDKYVVLTTILTRKSSPFEKPCCNKKIYAKIPIFVIKNKT